MHERLKKTLSTALPIALLLLGAYAVVWLIPNILLACGDISPGPGQEMLLRYVEVNAKVLTGVGLLIGLYLAWKKLKTLEEGQITDRFSSAVEHLGSESESQRVGGIYALGRIGQDSPKDRGSITELICSFLKASERIADEEQRYKRPAGIKRPPHEAALAEVGKHFDWNPPAPADVRAAARVLRSLLPLANSDFVVDLGGADLRCLDFSGTDFREAEFYQAYLRNSDFQDVDFHGANLSFADGRQSGFAGADLRDANLIGADFSFCDLTKANLRGIRMVDERDIEENPDWDLDKIYEMRTVSFQGAKLRMADLSGACLRGMDFSFADLSSTKGLTQTMLQQAKGDRKTKVPEGLTIPEDWPESILE